MTFTIEQIKNYLLKQDSLGDVLYNLSEKNILKANEPEEVDEDELDEFDSLKRSVNKYIDEEPDTVISFYGNHK